MSSFGIFGIGDIEAAFQCLGTTEKDSDKLNMSTIGAVKNGAPVFQNQASRPVAVGCNASSMLNTLHSVMFSESFRVFAMHLNRGAMYSASVEISALCLFSESPVMAAL